MPNPNEAKLANRLEWDNPEFDKAKWGKGPWLNEPDKVQFIIEGYHALVLRSHHGALCGYVGVDKAHPCYGLSSENISYLIMGMDFHERLSEWSKHGRPLTKNKLPDIDIVGVPELRVHGGLTFAGFGASPSYENWLDFKKGFKKARKQAAKFPIGDAAQWLHKWASAEDSYLEFVRIVEQTCICLVPTTEEAQNGLWWLGFDCAHAGDRMPQIESTLKHTINFLNLNLDRPFGPAGGLEEVYRDLTYVEAECLQLAIQLRAIEDHAPLRSSPHDQNS
jgi:hypothetical protein